MIESIAPLSYDFDFRGSNSVAWWNGRQTLSRAYSFDGDAILRAGRGAPAPVVLDLLEVASAVYFADRLARRRDDRDRGRGVQWRRRLSLRVGVRDVNLWRHADVYKALVGCLEFLTEDRWEFDFVLRSAASWDIERQRALIEPMMSPNAGVMLYSGGLDSFAGIANLLDTPRSEWVLVSGVSNPRHKAMQSAQIAAARRMTPRQIFHITVPYSLEKLTDQPAEERSQRARSFLFLTLGAIAAHRVGAPAALMCENGIGAVNLPLDGTQLGTSNARAAHPLTLLRFNRLIEQLFDSPVQVTNPFWSMTKGDVCRHENVKALAHVIPSTFSCDSFPVRVPGKPQCGTCTSCILRRVSILAADLQMADRADWYLRDVTAAAAHVRAGSLHGVRVMDGQAQELRAALKSADAWRALTHAYPVIQRAANAYQELEKLPPEKVKATLIGLYSRYVREWEQFPARQRLRLVDAA